MKVGDYVRTKYGIAKIIDVKENPYGKKTIYKLDKAIFNVYDLQNGELACINPLIDEMIDKFDTHFGDEKEITKISHNIIDLIQVGDYVNGNKVADINGIIYVKDVGFLEEIEIKSIVTKEQFSCMEYEVK